jgi:hypothetical protein
VTQLPDSVALADKLVLVAIALFTIAVIWALRRSGARGGRLLTASIVAFNGVALIAMMVGHSLDIASRLRFHCSTCSVSPMCLLAELAGCSSC